MLHRSNLINLNGIPTRDCKNLYLGMEALRLLLDIKFDELKEHVDQRLNQIENRLNEFGNVRRTRTREREPAARPGRVLFRQGKILVTY